MTFMKRARPAVLAACACAAACGGDQLDLESRIDEAVTIEIAAPRTGASGDCDALFATRFCRDQFESVGTVVLRGGDRRSLALDDDPDGACGNVLWLRLVRLDGLGPVADEGTLFELPAEAQIEYGAGARHTVAFPSATVRLDEVGDADARQGGPPEDCAIGADVGADSVD